MHQVDALTTYLTTSEVKELQVGAKIYHRFEFGKIVLVAGPIGRMGGFDWILPVKGETLVSIDGVNHITSKDAHCWSVTNPRQKSQKG